MCVLCRSDSVWRSVTPWAVAHQAPLSMEFPRQEYWNGLPFPSPGDLPNPGIKTMSPVSKADSSPLSHLGSQAWYGVKSLSVSNSLWPHGLYRLWNSLGQKTGMGSLSLLQGIFPNQGLNPGLPHCRQILYQLSHQGSPRILEWVAYPFSRGSSRPRNWTRVSCIAGRFFTSWATRGALNIVNSLSNISTWF